MSSSVVHMPRSASYLTACETPSEQRADYYTTSPEASVGLSELDPRNDGFAPHKEPVHKAGLRIGRTVLGAAGRAHAASRR